MSVLTPRPNERHFFTACALTTGTARRRFALFAWLILAYNLPVILWGAYVRASFSGDGCGANWPFCNGQLIPRNITGPTAIEYAHRMMTGLDSFAILLLCAWAFLSFPRRHAVRLYALLSLAFLLIEAMLGAGLVLFRYVAKNQSAARALYLSAHLTNTMLLLGALTVTAWAAWSNCERIQVRNFSGRAIHALAIVLLVSITGAVAALGDTLFPASSLTAGMRQDFSRAASTMLRLRLLHPLIALLGAASLIAMTIRMLKQKGAGHARRAAALVLSITILQLGAGLLNLGLLAPMWMQLIHLSIADVLWIATMILALETSNPLRESGPDAGAESASLHQNQKER